MQFEKTQNCTKIPDISLKYLNFENEGFLLLPVSQEDELRYIKRLKIKKTTDIYEISTWVVTKCSFLFIELLSRIMNVCFSEGFLQLNLKQQMNFHSTKNNDPSLPENYSQTHILPSFKKILNAHFSNNP